MSLSVRLGHRFPDFELDVAFEAPEGVTALFGRSGSGKTTVVNALAGLLRPRSGRVAVDGRVLLDTEKGLDLPPHRRRVGYVFQDGRLFPHMSVARNLRYGGWFAARRPPRQAFDEILDMLGIEALLDRRPGALSGGEKQRVAIGRALLSGPDLLLMDEPLASLDEARKDEILPYLERLRDRTATPVLYVSHSVPEVARLATTVVTLRDGHVTAAGPAGKVLSDPANVPDLGVREAGSILDATVLAHHPDGLTELEAAGGRLLLPRMAAEPGRRIAVRIHAQDVILSRARPEGLSALNILAGTVAAVRRGEGPGVMVQLDCGGEMLLARLTRRSADALALEPGVPCHAVLKSVAVARGDVWTQFGG